MTKAWTGSATRTRQYLYGKTAVVKMAAQVRKMPLWKLQTVGTQQLDFLYGAGRSDRIVLKRGVAYCFRKHYPAGRRSGERRVGAVCAALQR